MKVFLLSLAINLVCLVSLGQYVVTNTNDSGPGSLRNGLHTVPAGSTITFSGAIAGSTIFVLDTMHVKTNVFVDGGSNDIKIDGGGSSGAFHLDLPVTFNLSNLTIQNCAASVGPAIYSPGSGNINIRFTKFIGNASGGDGGAIRTEGGNHTYENCEFIGNAASAWAGAIYKLFGTISIENCLFSGNSAANGGAVHIRGGSANYIVGSTFASNKSTGAGGAIYAQGTVVVGVRNSIFWHNSASGSILTGSAFQSFAIGSSLTVNVEWSIIEGSGGSGSWDTNYGVDFGNNLDSDPLFANLINPVSAPTIFGNFRPQSGSPAYNSGNNALSTVTNDLDGHNRIIYGSIDRGAYEFCTTYGSLNPVVCTSYLSPTGKTYTSTGTYFDTLVNVIGCDSVVVVNLTVNDSYDTISQVVCNSYTSPSGMIILSSGNFNDTIPNGLGCDSIININLTVNNTTYSSINANACNSYTSPSGTYSWNASGNFNDTIPNMAGCDSVITVNLSINNSASTIAETVCDSYTPPSGSPTYFVSGTYSDIIPNSVGCDSLITINLIILNATTNTITQSSCDSIVSPSGNQTFYTSGTYFDTLTNSVGCDSIITIQANVLNSSSSTISPVVCGFYNSPSGSNIWNVSGAYNDTIPNSAGCDSIITINLTVINNTGNIINPVVCDSFISPSGNYIYYTSGTFYDTLTNAAGCDSNITIQLTVLNSTGTTISPTACNNYTSPSGNYVWNSTGTYLDTLLNSLGCDSIITVNLTILTSSAGSISPAACDLFVSPSGAYVWNSSGTYSDTISNSAGCDSIITVILQVISIDTSTNPGDGIIESNDLLSTYQWIDCDDGTDIPGETAISFEPLVPGNYAVILNQGICIDTSACIQVDVSTSTPSAFSPNNDGTNDYWVIPLMYDYPVNTVIIYNRWGDQILSFENYDNQNVIWNGLDSDGDELSNGTYYYVINIRDLGQNFTGYVQITR